MSGIRSTSERTFHHFMKSFYLFSMQLRWQASGRGDWKKITIEFQLFGDARKTSSVVPQSRLTVGPGFFS